MSLLPDLNGCFNRLVERTLCFNCKNKKYSKYAHWYPWGPLGRQLGECYSSDNILLNSLRDIWNQLSSLAVLHGTVALGQKGHRFSKGFKCSIWGTLPPLNPADNPSIRYKQVTWNCCHSQLQLPMQCLVAWMNLVGNKFQPLWITLKWRVPYG